VIHILQVATAPYRDITRHLADRGARVTVLRPGPTQAKFDSKLAIVRAMLSPRLLKARGVWTRDDTVLAIGWQALPLQALIRIGYLPRPERFVVLGCFVHSGRVRRVINGLWRAVRGPGLGFVAFSEGERRNLIDACGIPPGQVHFHLWRQELDGRAAPEQVSDDGSIFSGGFSNRDYALLRAAAASLPAPLVIVASAHNGLPAVDGDTVRIHLDIPEAAFEALLARSRVVAMPLRSQGEACGQSVLLRVLRNGKPLVVTRHESLEAYLGSDYPGFVPPGDVDAMRTALARALADTPWRDHLSSCIRTAAARLDAQGEPGADIERFLRA